MQLPRLLVLVGLVAAGPITHSSEVPDIYDVTDPFNLSTLTACDAQPAGSGPLTYPDTPAAFLLNSVYTSVSSVAPTPSGFTYFTYTGIPYGIAGTHSSVHMPWANFLGFRYLTSYDTSKCATYCKATTGCLSFNVFYQRAPSVEASWDPTSKCYDPASTVQIMCTMWDRAVVKTDLEVNFGWQRGGFDVRIIASKAYNLK